MLPSCDEIIRNYTSDFTLYIIEGGKLENKRALQLTDSYSKGPHFILQFNISKTSALPMGFPTDFHLHKLTEI